MAILGVLRVKNDGLVTLGPPCGSFVWLNSATSGRRKDRPYGFEEKAYVEEASLTLGFPIRGMQNHVSHKLALPGHLGHIGVSCHLD